jgi:hypothetical protein
VEASRHVRTDAAEVERVAGWLAYEPLGWPEPAAGLDAPLGPDATQLTLFPEEATRLQDAERAAGVAKPACLAGAPSRADPKAGVPVCVGPEH